MKVFAEIVKGNGDVEDTEIVTRNMLWIRFEIGGHEIRVSEKQGVLQVNCSTGRLKVLPDSSNAIRIDAEGW